MRRPRFRKPRDREELRILIGAVALLAMIWVFATLADRVFEGETRQFDEWVLSSLRQRADPSQLKGPRWLAAGAQDITALGGPTVYPRADCASDQRITELRQQGSGDSAQHVSTSGSCERRRSCGADQTSTIGCADYGRCALE